MLLRHMYCNLSYNYSLCIIDFNCRSNYQLVTYNYIYVESQQSYSVFEFTNFKPKIMPTRTHYV